MVLTSASFGKVDRWEWFRRGALLNAAGQLVYALWPLPPAQFVVQGIAIILLTVMPWFVTRWAYVWWPCYAFLIYLTYPLGCQVCSYWVRQQEQPVPFSANPLWFQAMMIYGTALFLFLVAQIVVLPFYRQRAVAAAGSSKPVAVGE